jgi:hypothetical protein
MVFWARIPARENDGRIGETVLVAAAKVVEPVDAREFVQTCDVVAQLLRRCTGRQCWSLCFSAVPIG